MTTISATIDGTRTRDQIVDSARELCREIGYDQFTMVMVARRVGCSRTTIYNHFADRDDLLAALCTAYLDGYLDIQAQVRGWARAHHTIFEVLRETIVEELRWRVANGDLRGALDAAKGKRKEFFLAGDRRIDEAMIGWFGRIYTESGRRGLLRDGVDVTVATHAIYAMVDHVVAEFPVDTSPHEVGRTTDQVARLQWQALFRMAPENAPPFQMLHLTLDAWHPDTLPGVVTGRSVGVSRTPTGAEELSR